MKNDAQNLYFVKIYIVFCCQYLYYKVENNSSLSVTQSGPNRWSDCDKISYRDTLGSCDGHWLLFFLIFVILTIYANIFKYFSIWHAIYSAMLNITVAKQSLLSNKEFYYLRKDRLKWASWALIWRALTQPYEKYKNNVLLNILLPFHFFALVSRLNATLNSATQHAMPPEFGRKWGTECLNTRFPLLILVWADYSVKLIMKINK